MNLSLRPSTKETGTKAEDLACEHLKKRRIEILSRNFRSRFGEIDIIAKEKNCILFVEVKFRKSNTHGEPFESVTHLKQRKIIQTAQYYLMQHDNFTDFDYRFDVISIHDKRVTWLKNAFDANHE